MASQATPRVNLALLPRYIERTVRLVGRVLAMQPDGLYLETTDGGKVKVVLTSGDGAPAPGQIIEIIGQVLDKESVKEFNWTPFHEGFDLQAYESFIQLAHQHPNLFATQ